MAMGQQTPTDSRASGFGAQAVADMLAAEQAKTREAFALQQQAMAKQVEQLEEMRVLQQSLAARDEEIASLRLAQQRMQQDEVALRRKVVHDMAENWGGISKVVESALLENAVHSPGAERALHEAADKSREAAEADGSQAAGSGAEESSSSASRQPEWSGAEWVESLGVAKLVADALLARARGAPLTFVRSLAEDEEHGRDALLSILRVGLLEKLSERIWEGMRRLVQSTATSGAALHAKFIAEGETFKLSYGGLEVFFGGLESLIGPPNPNLKDAMEREHCHSADSTQLFRTSNYGIDTRRDM